MVKSWDMAVERVQERLAAAPALRAVTEGEGREFALWDLAACAEGELGEPVDPAEIGPAEEARLRARLGESGREWPGGELYRRRYWLLGDGGPRAPGGPGGPAGPIGPVGTVAVDNWTRGAGQLAVSSLYLRPDARGRGLAAAALDRVYRAATAEGLSGYRLEADWAWPRAVHYYLRRGLWVRSWKHTIGLTRMPQLPLYRVREEQERLVLLVADRPSGAPAGEVWTPLLAAGREGRWLRLDETAAYRQADGWVHDYARSTLALHLALAGRPLVRGPQWWAEAWRWSDGGEPEGLAHWLERFERRRGAAGRTSAPSGAVPSGAVLPGVMPSGPMPSGVTPPGSTPPEVGLPAPAPAPRPGAVAP
ncbi:GNAT family N-acetyltransferase [Streptomyces sp. TLI_053]|uniref:GNAT family N-acetyltransferase n=1 Tax=Streptomyces sp. TLI_053 TaxID=1855352 RepID=UPI00135207A4|nr:GNAT family N-acetyltransferase [Streptomyces sp. TLI_053]